MVAAAVVEVAVEMTMAAVTAATAAGTEGRAVVVLAPAAVVGLREVPR